MTEHNDYSMRDPGNPYEEPVRVYLGHVTVDHQLAYYLKVFVNDVEVDNVVEAQEGDSGWVRAWVTDSRGNILPGPVPIETAGRVHYELQPKSGLSDEQIKLLQDPKNGRLVDKSRLSRAKPQEIADCFPTRKRRVSRFV